MNKSKTIIMILKEISDKKKKSIINKINYQIKKYHTFIFSQIMNKKNILFLKEIQEVPKYLTEFNF